MNYNIKKIQADSKQRYIDLGIYVEGCDISGKLHEEHVQAANCVNTQLAAGNLPQISTQVCLDCGEQAKHYHHNISYREEHWLCIVPLCVSCHYSLHTKIVNDVFYDFGIIQSVSDYLTENPNITLGILASIHGMSRHRVSAVCSTNKLQTKFQEQRFGWENGQHKPDKLELEQLYTQLQSARKVAKELGVDAKTIWDWLNEYNIPINESNYNKSVRLKLSNEELLTYIIQGYTRQQIADTIGVHKATIGKWIASLPKDKLAQAVGKEKYNKNIYMQIKRTKAKLKIQHYRQNYIDSVVSEMEKEFI
ncbi:MAG: hypothetical protein DRP85_08780 [Candidatus Makaraimicrobium thalassicum]|nr:MAG: hypothetical protein DRP85_08780 [Candidatus Omnitrophota bacterium]